jgi:hypothetical protein
MPTIEAMTLKPAEELGPVLTSRGRATALREAIEQAVIAGDEVTIDFIDVETMSPSFADELFAKIDPNLFTTGSVRFENVPEAVEPLIRFVIGRRRAAAEV